MAVGMRPSDIGQMQTVSAPAEPFVWGKGGRRMTPEQIAQEQQIAQALMQPDFSPVGHWTQGLGRVAQAALGNLREGRADRAGEANAAETASIAQLLMNPTGASATGGTPRFPVSPGGEVPAPGGNPAIAQAATNQYIDPSVRKMAMTLMKPKEPIEIAGKLVDPVTMKVLGDYNTPDMFTQMVSGAGIDPKTPEGMGMFRQRAQTLADPIVNIPLPGGNAFIGPRSEMAAAIERMGKNPPSGQTAPPNMLPPDFDFDDGGQTPTASGGFR